MQFIENDAEIIYEGKKLRFDTTEGVQRAEAFIRMKEVVDLETGVKVPRTKVSYCYNSLTPKAPSEPFVVPCIEGRGRKKRGENIMTHVVLRFPERVCVPIAVRTQATRTVKSHRPVTPKIALEIGKKWIKQAYGNIDYMCGIHIDQPDMLMHFLIFTRDINEGGEQIARELFKSYKLDQFIPELGGQELDSQEESEKVSLSEDDVEQDTSFAQQMISQMDWSEPDEEPARGFLAQRQSKPVEQVVETIEEPAVAVMEEPEESPVLAEPEPFHMESVSSSQSTASFAGMPVEIEKARDVDSVVARVRASLAEQNKQSHSAEVIQEEAFQKSQALFQSSFVERRRPEPEFIPEQEGPNQVEMLREESRQNEIFQREQDFAYRAQFQNSAAEPSKPAIDPLEQIKLNAANLLNQIHAQDMPSLQGENESEEKEAIQDKQNESEKRPMTGQEILAAGAGAFQTQQNVEKKEIESKSTNEKLMGSGDFLSKLGKSEDEMLYDESEYAKAPVGEVVWGSGASNPNVFDELPEEQKAPDVHFYVQNAFGEHEIPEEFQMELSEADRQQQTAAASYVKELKKIRFKKWGWILGVVVLLIVIIALFVLFS